MMNDKELKKGTIELEDEMVARIEQILKPGQSVREFVEEELWKEVNKLKSKIAEKEKTIEK